ncbi:MAG TPA: aminopeptidase N [Caulobacteraceae bacterium]|jgi:aminopeptidase N|nr:aminopeptidase N [Caulobacteraceae bacterium]
MRTDIPQPIRLSEYRPPAYLIDEVHLDFRLEPTATRVRARLTIRRDGDHAEPLRLDGVRLKPVSVAIDGRVLGAEEYQVTAEDLTIPNPAAAFTLETEVEIDPQANTFLEGLYMSAGRFCTQCEAEGFRKITWFADRPDVLARYTVRMEADKQAYPRLLANGNLTLTGDLEGGRHFAVWNDPFPKPCYLFALVAGELDVLESQIVTMSGRTAALRIYVDTGMADRAAYAMDSLKRAMKWDEDTFGREYDLDLFMIVAVRDFNFGAMENKGLNVFNSSLLLADPATATDFDYERIEGVVAHEYFHNWTGNRITCRDWFQLCLKEGLTVFRDQSFSADQRGHAVQRIKEVKALRARQFAEDAGPMAHPVRPSSYLKIDNFYTATIYDKGAELIRMLKTIIGAEGFRAGMDVYFERWDGHATTVEAFIQCFADASGRDLSDFFAWYEQAGTPRVSIASTYDEAAHALDLTLSQSVAPTPGQPDKRALPTPILIGLLDEDGRPLPFRAPDGAALVEEMVVVLDRAEKTVRLEGVARRPVLSPLRGFSAPVNLTTDAPAKDRYILLSADPDLFNRWEAGQGLARDLILARASGAPDEVGEERYAEAVGRALDDQSAEDAFKALLLALPSESDLSLVQTPSDPAAIHEARDALRGRLAIHLGDALRRLHGALQSAETFSPDADSAGRRALRNAALDLLAADSHAQNLERAIGHFQAAANMTDAMGGLSALMVLGGEPYDQALTDFYARWKDEPLVIDKWFALQARSPNEDVLGRVLGLTAHPAFDAKNPNRLRALVQSFASGNPARFHDPSGAGYRFLADQILAVDGFNPMTAARLIEPLGGWRRYKPELGALMREQLQRIVDTPGLSKNVFEMASRALA